jgi:hypothetical protein
MIDRKHTLIRGTDPPSIFRNPATLWIYIRFPFRNTTARSDDCRKYCVISTIDSGSNVEFCHYRLDRVVGS